MLQRLSSYEKNYLKKKSKKQVKNEKNENEKLLSFKKFTRINTQVF